MYNETRCSILLFLFEMAMTGLELIKKATDLLSKPQFGLTGAYDPKTSLLQLFACGAKTNILSPIV